MMPLSLHVYPPAFSLPSIDAECLAAIAYLSRALPASAWTLIAEPGLSEGQDELPCLRDGGKTVVGFEPIVKHLRERSRGQWDLDAGLSVQQGADCLAFTTHLTTTLPPLLDLSLYICAENYTSTTRRAYSATLPFPESWAVPPARHALAQRRTSHLGITPADLSPPSSAASSPDAGPVRGWGDPPRRGSFQKPRGGKMKVGVVASTAAVAQRLNRLIEAALAPLATLHAENGRTYLLADTPSSLDCLALGYLALSLMPCLENAFLSSGVAAFEGLEAYTRRGVKEAFGRPVTASDALVRAPVVGEEVEGGGEDDEEVFGSYGNVEVGSGGVVLPWRRRRSGGVGERVRGVVRIVAS